MMLLHIGYPVLKFPINGFMKLFDNVGSRRTHTRVMTFDIFNENTQALHIAAMFRRA